MVAYFKIFADEKYCKYKEQQIKFGIRFENSDNKIKQWQIEEWKK